MLFGLVLNASCERAFSTMKRIKSDWRCMLGAEILDILMRIQVADVALRYYDPKPAVTRWWLSGLRQKRPHTLSQKLRHSFQTMLYF